MGTFHLFNPENDLALGVGCRNYTPPQQAAALHDAGCLLPMWWAEDGDRILAPESYQARAEKLRNEFGLYGEIGYDSSVSKLSPWGWSLDAKRQFEAAGAPSSLSPTNEMIERIRQLSHRRTSLEILRRIGYPHDMPIETDDPNVAVRFCTRNSGCFVKSPWSCSGRGVFNSATLDDKTLKKRVDGIIRHQGSVLVEPALSKTADFAVLFHSDGENVKFRGLSYFYALARGVYTGNVVASQETIRRELSKNLSLDKLDSLISQLETILTQIVPPLHIGWLGIDMMTHIINGKEEIMPCVELNLRMTMGVVAMKMHEKLNNSQPMTVNWELSATDGFVLSLKNV